MTPFVSSKQRLLQVQVPQLKRRLEQLLIMTKGLLQSSGTVQHILVGNLRHKDLTGQVVPSQAYRESSSDEDGNDEENDAAGDESAPGICLQICLCSGAFRAPPNCLNRCADQDVFCCQALQALASGEIAWVMLLSRGSCLQTFTAGAEPSASRQTSNAVGSREEVSAAAYAVKAESEDPMDRENSSADGEGEQ